ncbi:hypothetical protein Trydic_g2071 [Trypoxylus dichotomus]
MLHQLLPLFCIELEFLENELVDSNGLKFLAVFKPLSTKPFSRYRQKCEDSRCRKGGLSRTTAFVPTILDDALQFGERFVMHVNCNYCPTFHNFSKFNDSQMFAEQQLLIKAIHVQPLINKLEQL